MVPPDAPRPPVPVMGRDALERILARATELAMREYRDGGDGLSEERLLEVAREAGLDPEAMRRAMAEERAGAVAESSPAYLGARLIGAGSADESRVVPGTPTAVLDRLERELTTRHGLIVHRRRDGALLLGPRAGLWGSVSAALNLGGHGYPLRAADQLHVRVADYGGGRVFVRLFADVSRRRALRETFIWIPGILTGITGLGAAATLALGGAGPVPRYLGALALVLGALATPAAIAIARGGWAGQLERMSLALGLVLDQLEGPEPPRSSKAWLPFP